jgi:hypothetical protein
MTSEETFRKLNELRLYGFARGLEAQLAQPQSYTALAFEERLGLLVDREWTEREACRLTRRLQLAKLRDRQACVEDVDFRHPRGLDRALLQRLAAGEWITRA